MSVSADPQHTGFHTDNITIGEKTRMELGLVFTKRSPGEKGKVYVIIGQSIYKSDTFIAYPVMRYNTNRMTCTYNGAAHARLVIDDTSAKSKIYKWGMLPKGVLKKGWHFCKK
jgi:hypothetical protein